MLRYGDKGAAVQVLQQQLNAFGYNLDIDGIFGELTDNAVRNFQGKRGITPNGVVDEGTTRHLLTPVVPTVHIPVVATGVTPAVAAPNMFTGPGVFGYPVWAELSAVALLGLVLSGSIFKFEWK